MPAVNKNIAEGIQAMRTSKYRAFVNIEKDAEKELYYDTIRLGYVHVFHKMESFYKELLLLANMLYSEEGNMTIEAYYKAHYSVDVVKNWKRNFVCEKINWICNRVKHTDGYPENYPQDYYETLYPKDKKIRIEKDEFLDDIDSVQQIYHTMMQVVFGLGTIMMFNEMNIDDDVKATQTHLFDQMKQNANLLLDFYHSERYIKE